MDTSFEVDFSNLPSEEDRERQAAWREQSVQPIKAARRKRLQVLNQERDAIMRATDAYTSFDHGDVPWIRLHKAFVAGRAESAEPDESQEPQELSPAERRRSARRQLRSRPPLTRLTHRQSNALSLYLTAVYVAHQEISAGSSYVNNRHNLLAKAGRSGWIWLAGMSAPKETRARRSRIRRALDELVAANLAKIDVPGAPGRYENWALLADDGTGGSYRVPGERDPDAMRLPATFFFNGWHLVLAPGEIAMLLALMHRGSWSATDLGYPAWVSLPRQLRSNSYGLSGEMYLHAQQLVEFELVEFHDPMPNRRRGKIKFKKPVAAEPGEVTDTDNDTPRRDFKPVPYEFRPAAFNAFDRNALTVAQRTLTALPIPYRLDSEGALIAPQDYVDFRLKAMASQHQSSTPAAR